MVIDNFAIVRERLDFYDPYDRFVIHVMKRDKDDDTVESNGSHLIKTWYVPSLEYFDMKADHIRSLCNENHARAYILPQVRSSKDCLKELVKIAVDGMDDPAVHPDRLVRRAFCGHHGSRAKRWIFDLDNDNMREKISYSDEGLLFDGETTWTVEMVKKCIGDILEANYRDRDEIWTVPTPNGNCLVTPPFDLKRANCGLMFEGVHADGTHGWLIKDGMVLLYANI